MARPTTPLSPGARLYVGGVILLGTALLVACFPTDGFRDPTLFVILLVLSALTSTFKVNLPLARSGSTMSVSYAVDFASLLLLGPHETMLVAAASAWSCSASRRTAASRSRHQPSGREPRTFMPSTTRRG